MPTHLWGAFFKILNLTLFTAISLLFLHLDTRLSILDECFVVAFFGTSILLPWMIYSWSRHMSRPSVQAIGLYMLRAVFSIGGTWTWIHALQNIGPHDATLIGYLTPLLTIVFASLIREEKIQLPCLIGILACITAFFIFLSDGTMLRSYFGLNIALLSAACWAAYDVVCKVQGRREHFLNQAFYALLCAMILMAPFCYESITQLSNSDLPVLGIIGLLRIMNVVCLFLAYRLSPLAFLMPLSYLRLVLMSVAVFCLSGDLPSEGTVICATIVVTINLYLFVRYKPS